MEPTDFSQFDNEIQNNFYSDDFAHLQSLGRPDENGNYLNIYIDKEFDSFGDEDSENFDFI